MDLNSIVQHLDAAGVSKVILSARGKVKPNQIASLTNAHPERIIAAVRTKGWAYAKNKKGYYKLLNKQLGMPEFRAMAELILWHAAKGNKAPEWEVPVATPQVQAALNATYKKGWPAVLHYEFAASGGRRGGLMDELEALLAEKPDHPFVLTHMAQLELPEVIRLIEKHKNIHFIPSWSNAITATIGNQPWVNLFSGDKLAADWKALLIKHPDRFVLGFDNVWEDHWGDHYTSQVKLWQEVFKGLPEDVAHAIAHKNAERLWNLKPL